MNTVCYHQVYEPLDDEVNPRYLLHKGALLHTASTPRAHQGWDVLATAAVLQGTCPQLTCSSCQLVLSITKGILDNLNTPEKNRNGSPLGATRSMAI